MPTVTLVLPVYNVEKYIERCLDSCINQTYKEIEIILVDDCGSDSSIEKAEAYSAKDSRVKIIHNPTNLGTYHARRVGVEKSNTDYILFLDPDDELELDTIENLLYSMNKQFEIIFFGSRRVPSSKKWGKESKTPVLNNPKNKNEIITNIFKCKNLCYGTEGKIIKKAVLLKAYLELDISIDERLTYGEDVLLLTAVLTIIENAASIDKNLYIYHKNNESITVIDTRYNSVFKYNKLRDIIEKIKSIKSYNDLDSYIKNHISRRLELDSLNIMVPTEENEFKKIKLYMKVIYIRKSIRPIIKLSLHLVTLGKIKL